MLLHKLQRTLYLANHMQTVVDLFLFFLRAIEIICGLNILRFYSSQKNSLTLKIHSIGLCQS